ncbi:MAG: acetoacetate decarboxylase family protein [Paracoccaceae bacterium]
MGKFRFNPDARYRMPVIFGPVVGPRQAPDLGRYDPSTSPYTVTTVRFRTDPEAIDALLPERFTLDGEAVVTLEHTVLTNLGWLAGRGYTMLGVKFPVRFDGRDGAVRGDLLAVLWENLTAPILSGREELGFAKIHCDLPEAQEHGNRRICRASWDGFEFLEMTLDDLHDAPVPPSAPRDGILHYGYRPPLVPGRPHDDGVQVMLSPTTPAPTVQRNRAGIAGLTIRRASFEQLPTMFHIVNALADLPPHEMLGGRVWHGTGKTDLSEQRPLF